MWEITRSNRARFIRKCLAFPPFGEDRASSTECGRTRQFVLSCAATEPAKSHQGHQHLMRKGSQKVDLHVFAT
jgi:hypothetical protein